MDFQQLIINRESIRDYDPGRKVEKEKLARILEAGRLAPSAANKQPWKFYLISSKENLSKIQACYPRAWFKNAPHVLVVAGKKTQAWTRQSDGYNSLETDLTIAMDHMILAAEADGVGTCWIAAFDHEVLKDTGLFEKDDTVFAITPLGYQNKGFTKSASKKRKPFNEVTAFI